MMRTIFLILLFVISLLVTLVATAPLSFALQQSGVHQSGLSWTGASGSIFSGKVTGLRFGAQPIGTVALNAESGALLKGEVRYRFELQGAAAVGRGAVALGQHHLELSDFDTEIFVAQLVGIANEVRAVNGTATIEGGAVLLRDGACKSAAGRVQTDLLTKLAAEKFRREASALAGELSCDGEMVLLEMDGLLETTDFVGVRVRAGVTDVSSVQVQVQTVDPVLEAGLSIYGFEFLGDGYVYRQDASFVRGAR